MSDEKVKFCGDESINETCNERLTNIIGDIGNMTLNQIFNLDDSGIHIKNNTITCSVCIDDIFVKVTINNMEKIIHRILELLHTKENEHRKKLMSWWIRLLN